MRAQLQDDLVFDGYDQDAWVRVQRYQDRSWAELIQVWCASNHQVASIMRDAPASDLDPRVRATTLTRSASSLFRPTRPQRSRS